MDNQIGVCDLCGGPVIVPTHSVWPTPHCVACGALVANAQPVIKMNPNSVKRPFATRPCALCQRAIPVDEHINVCGQCIVERQG